MAEIGGGKFANGAWTAAFQHLLNNEAVIGAAAFSGGGIALGEILTGIVAAPAAIYTGTVVAGFTIGAVIGDYVGEKIGRALNPIPQEIVADIGPGIKYAGEKYKCEEYADGLSVELSKRKIDHKVIVYDSQIPRSDVHPYIYADYGLIKYGVVSANGRHVGVLVGNLMFDNNAPSGVPFTQWVGAQHQADLRHGGSKPIGAYVTEGRANIYAK